MNTLKVKALESGVKFRPFPWAEVVESVKGEIYETPVETARMLTRPNSEGDPPKFTGADFNDNAPPTKTDETELEIAWAAGFQAREEVAIGIRDEENRAPQQKKASEAYKTARAGLKDARDGKDPAQPDDLCYMQGYKEWSEIVKETSGDNTGKDDKNKQGDK